MASIVNVNASAVSPIISDIGASRRKIVKLQTELQALYEELNKSAAHDKISNQIREWVDSFKEALSYSNELNIDQNLGDFIKSMHEILVDPIRGPLDENSVLCSDGNTYSSMTYSLFQDVPGEFRNRSPVDLLNNQAQTFIPHPHLKSIFSWLEKYQAVPKSEELEKEYASLKAEHKSPAVSISISPVDPIDREIADYLSLLEQKDDHKEEPSPFSQEVRKLQSSLEAEAKEIRDQMVAQNASQQQRHAAFIKEQRNRANQAIERLRKDVQQLRNDHQTLRNDVKSVANSIDKVHQMDNDLEKKIQETKQAIEEKEKEMNEIKEIVTAVGIIGACAFGCWALSGLLEGTGFSLTFSATANGGKIFGAAAF